MYDRPLTSHKPAPKPRGKLSAEVKAENKRLRAEATLLRRAIASEKRRTAPRKTRVSKYMYDRPLTSHKPATAKQRREWGL